MHSGRKNSFDVYYTILENNKPILKQVNRKAVDQIISPNNRFRTTNRALFNPFFGLGLGLQYGGIGANVQYCLNENFSLFGGLGYNLYQLGYNFGAKINLNKPYS